MLKALARYILRKDAPATPKGRSEAFVTPEELAAALQKLEQKVEWELGEWYDKFSALHARAEKRAQREIKKNGQSNGHHVVVEQKPASDNRVLANRRAWSP